MPSKTKKVKALKVEKKTTRVKKATPVKKTVPAKKPTLAKKTGIEVSLYSISGRVVGKKVLPKEIFGAKINKTLLAQAVRVYLANQRGNLASTKTRGEVRGGGAKPWKQKGTGRARAGSIRSPLWRGGGIVFGPRPKDVRLELPKKMKRAALFSALSDKAQGKNIVVVSGLEKIEAKTKAMDKVIKSIGESAKKAILVLPEKLENLERAARNLKGLTLMRVENLNTYEIMRHKNLIFLEKTIDKIGEVFTQKKDDKK